MHNKSPKPMTISEARAFARKLERSINRFGREPKRLPVRKTRSTERNTPPQDAA